MTTISKEQESYIKNIKRGILKKFPLLGATMSKLTFVPNNGIKTAETDGDHVYYSEKFMSNLTHDEQLFIFSHEIMHVAFDHIMRSKDRNLKLWNRATDAVINQLLINENLPMVKGAVNIAEALNKSAEEVYNGLIKDLEAQRNKKNQNENQDNTRGQSQGKVSSKGQANVDQSINDKINTQRLGKNNGNGRDNGQLDSNDDFYDIDNDDNLPSATKGGTEEWAGVGQHDIWGKVVKNAEQKANDKKNDDNKMEKQGKKSDVERNFAMANAKLKEKIANEVKEKLREQKQNIVLFGSGAKSSFSLGDLGFENSLISWKTLLKRSIDREEDMWSYRRADADNFYQARIESRDVENFSITEVLLDTSGSVSDELLRSFIRQLKPVLKESRLFVGCFDHAFYGFQEIKNVTDINHFTIRGRGGTNFDLAVQSFTNKREINKIIFTDGDDIVSNTEANKKKNVIWVVYDNKKFLPPFGKVIHVSAKEIIKYNENITENCRQL